MSATTDIQLQQALAKMLPEKIKIHKQGHGLDPQICFFWRDGQGRQVVDTEMLHVCWLIEQEFDSIELSSKYFDILTRICTGKNWVYNASWQQRALAICKVRGVEIVCNI